MSIRKIKVKEALDALDKNGYPWTQGDFLTPSGASCAVGQMARNLGLDAKDTRVMWELSEALYHVLPEAAHLYGGARNITTINDRKAYTSYEQVVAAVHEVYDAADPETEIAIYVPD